MMVFLTTGRLAVPHSSGKPSFFELCTEIGQIGNGVVILDNIFNKSLSLFARGNTFPGHGTPPP